MLQRIDERIYADLTRLNELDQRLMTLEVPEGYDDVARFQRATLDYGLAANRFTLDWFRNLSRYQSPNSTQ